MAAYDIDRELAGEKRGVGPGIGLCVVLACVAGVAYVSLERFTDAPEPGPDGKVVLGLWVATICFPFLVAGWLAWWRLGTRGASGRLLRAAVLVAGGVGLVGYAFVATLGSPAARPLVPHAALSALDHLSFSLPALLVAALALHWLAGLLRRRG